MIQAIWIVQPLAFARIGSSPIPLQNFYWTSNDLHPRGAGRTQIAEGETLQVADDGTVSALRPQGNVVFKDETGIRPVCPFFELWGSWDEGPNGPGSGPLTPAILIANGKKPEDIHWHVDHRNWKAFHLTRSAGDRIEASVDLTAQDYGKRVVLEGKSPAGADAPLIPPAQSIPMGAVQLTKPSDAFPEFRLRFYAPAGHAYAPQGKTAAIQQLLAAAQAGNGSPALPAGIGGLLSSATDNSIWKDFTLPVEREILNPAAAWPTYTLLQFLALPGELRALLPRAAEVLADRGRGDRSQLLRLIAGPTTDVGNLPPALFAYVSSDNAVVASVGMVDQLGDGVITCTLDGLDPAHARIVVAPPVFAPDRRQPVSLADGLTDREKRAEVRDPVYFDDWKAASAEVYDVLNRAFEAAGLSNLDVWNQFFMQENSHRAMTSGSAVSPDQAAARLWNCEALPSVHELPLTETGRQRHRRNMVREFFDALVGDNPALLERWIRVPGERERLYDQRMPGLMRGADRQPLHLTRRQFELIQGWARQLQQRGIPKRMNASSVAPSQSAPN